MKNLPHTYPVVIPIGAFCFSLKESFLFFSKRIISFIIVKHGRAGHVPLFFEWRTRLGLGRWRLKFCNQAAVTRFQFHGLALDMNIRSFNFDCIVRQ